MLWHSFDLIIAWIVSSWTWCSHIVFQICLDSLWFQPSQQTHFFLLCWIFTYSTHLLICLWAECKHLMVQAVSENIWGLWAIILWDWWAADVVLAILAMFIFWTGFATYAMAKIARSCHFNHNFMIFVMAHHALGLKAFPAAENPIIRFIIWHGHHRGGTIVGWFDCL